MSLTYENSYLVREYPKSFNDTLLRDDLNAIDARQATAWHEPSSRTSLNEDTIYKNPHLTQEACHDPALEGQTRKHLLYAQWVGETNAEPIDPNSVTVLTARLGRTVMRATRRMAQQQSYAFCLQILPWMPSQRLTPTGNILPAQVWQYPQHAMAAPWLNGIGTVSRPKPKC